MSNSWTLIHEGIVSIGIYPSECGKLNISSYVLTFALKIVALQIFGFGNVMVSSVNKFSYAMLNIYFSLYVTPSIKS
jgi:hypothetical protein